MSESTSTESPGATWKDIERLRFTSPLVNLVLSIARDQSREQQLIAMVLGYEAQSQDMMQLIIREKLEGRP